jgi:hypothetical protein
MSEEYSTLDERARQWALAFESVIGRFLSEAGSSFSVEFEDGGAGQIQKQLEVRSRIAAGPSLVITCEESQAFLAVDQVPDVSVLYEFDGMPNGLDAVTEETSLRTPPLMLGHCQNFT